ncbi:hypothetical protein [Acetobacter oeni]|uniref:Uncharacterized protein n=1 Tax=Acetobacter oeni TaxID=304077 RepID=A0A511XIV9_9PROT|nr:hypothetical protein [Acetobacter oeni]MBB3881955.1 hypothetical protein [Acetobacter oeni]GEN62851.1 hypothetical protein AOE01nite_10750 [Acetobacter oeni]
MENSRSHVIGDARIVKIPDMTLAALSPRQLLPDWNDGPGAPGPGWTTRWMQRGLTPC